MVQRWAQRVRMMTTGKTSNTAWLHMSFDNAISLEHSTRNQAALFKVIVQRLVNTATKRMACKGIARIYLLRTLLHWRPRVLAASVTKLVTGLEAMTRIEILHVLPTHGNLLKLRPGPSWTNQFSSIWLFCPTQRSILKNVLVLYLMIARRTAVLLKMNDDIMISGFVLLAWSGQHEPLPERIADCFYRQYGSGKHASQTRRRLGSLIIKRISYQGVPAQIRHLVIQASSQWVIGRNVTRHCDVLHIGENRLMLPSQGETSVLLATAMVTQDLHRYLPLSVFFLGNLKPSLDECVRANYAIVAIHSSETVRACNQLRAVVHQTHRHICGHSSYEDMKLLLKRNDV